MADEQPKDIVQTLKERGVSCAKLKSAEERERREAGEFRKIGFSQIAEAQEQSAEKIKQLRNQVCKLH